MKKLMIAAAVAAMVGGAFAGSAGTVNPQLWNVKFNLKTLDTKQLNCGGAYKEGCETCGVKIGYDYITSYLETATRKIEGILVNCDYCYNTFADNDNASNIVFVAWDATKKQYLTKVPGTSWNADFALTNGCALINYNGELIACLFGKKQNKAYVEFSFAIDDHYSWWYETKRPSYQLVAQAFGSWDAKNDRVNSVSGQAMGYIGLSNGYGDGWTRSLYYSPKTLCWAVDYCDADYNGSAIHSVPAFGSFSMKFNSSKAKNYHKAIPDYDYSIYNEDYQSRWY